ncbi:uncharacterized mitochondrial protein AtMg00810-like [Phragmites australis]|uniref:uncharacterized mitochondrial protein AtMg00810-like n=1 Tax=Phragmites australis TaxID=29695 RepID=UPI002D781A07|nr:uncharacterized mitochondrial protein AtMg00810-like [Phragmites australis]
MANCKAMSMPVNTKPKVSSEHGTKLPDATSYSSLAGAFQYLTMTRRDISYAVQQVCLHMHDPRDCHMAMVKHILRYIRDTTHLGLYLRALLTTTITMYSDVDWAGCLDMHRSSSGYCIFLGDSLVSWSSKQQPMVS